MPVHTQIFRGTWKRTYVVLLALTLDMETSASVGHTQVNNASQPCFLKGNLCAADSRVKPRSRFRNAQAQS